MGTGRGTPVNKRYRYTGKERDEESGLYYFGARYYACWIGRWTAADPIGVGDGLNLYAYCRGNPVKLTDPSGTQSFDWKELAKPSIVPQNSTRVDLSYQQTVPMNISDKASIAYSSSYPEQSSASGVEDESGITDIGYSKGSKSSSRGEDEGWAPSINDIGYNEGSKITLDKSGKKIAKIETIEGGNLTTEIYLANGELLYRGNEVGVQNYYNDPENREIINNKGKTQFLGDITSQARQYFEAFQRNTPIVDLLRSGTDAKFDFKGKEWINSENANDIVILGGHVMTLRDAGNFLFGYSTKAKQSNTVIFEYFYTERVVARGGGFDELNKGGLNKINNITSFYEPAPPYFGEASRSANMSYLGMSLFAPRK